jgi:hypothetical protein
MPEESESFLIGDNRFQIYYEAVASEKLV